MGENKPKINVLGQSLASMLTSLDLIPDSNKTYRRYFYDFLTGLGLLVEGRATPKAVEMGYAQENEGAGSWYEWNMDFFFSQIGLKHSWLGGYMSKSKIYETLKRVRHNIDEDETLNLLRNAMKPYSECGDYIHEMIPNKKAMESGIARKTKYYEWNPECLTEICQYFLELKGISKSKKITLDEAKSHVSWMGKNSMSPGEEAPMSLLLEVDPECFERVNSIPVN